jgi:RNA polymerase sigma factor (sigma-70 family)
MSSAVEEGRLPHLGRNAEHDCERLYGRHAEDVRRYARMVLRNRSDADDVVQQTFLNALRALRAGVRPERPRQWLIAIAHNECRMHFRRASRRPLEVDLEHAAEAVAGEEGSASAEAVREALGHLAPNQRTALVLRELEGRTYDEIAETLGLSGAAVETLLFRARRALREQLETTGSCDDAQALLAADHLDELSRRRLRAHARTCRACATLERRRRGRIAAAGRRLAGLLPFPSWLPTLFEGGAAGGAKAVAVVAAAAVATTGAVEATTNPHRPHAAEPRLAAQRVVPAAAPAIRSARGAAPLVAPPAPAQVAAPRLRPRRVMASRPTVASTRAVAPVPAPATPPTTTGVAAPPVDASEPTAEPRAPAVAQTPAVATPAQPAAHRRHRARRGRSEPDGDSSSRQEETPPVLPSLPDPTAAVPTLLPDPPALPPVTVTVDVPQPPLPLPTPPTVTVSVPSVTVPTVTVPTLTKP